MRFRLHCLIAFLATGLLLTGQSAGAPGDETGPAVAPKPSPWSNKPIPELIDALASDDYAIRRQATRVLKRQGAEAAKALGRAAETGGLELSLRAVDVLEKLYVDGSERAVAAAEAALDQLAQSSNSQAASQAELVMNAHYDIRRERAVASIEKLGGTVEYRKIRDRTDPKGFRKVIKMVRLNSDWQGGEKGLRHIKRLDGLKTLYQIKGNGVSKQALQKLQKTMPQLDVQYRGSAFLGIQGMRHPRGCGVFDVTPGSAAQKAGLRRGDVIIGFNEKNVPDFQTVIDLIKKKNAGDKVKLRILRNQQQITKDVVLGSWSQQQN